MKAVRPLYHVSLKHLHPDDKAALRVSGGTHAQLYLDANKPEELLELLEVCVVYAARWFRENLWAPEIRESGVYYELEPPGLEQWLGPRELLRRGKGDCEDLAIYLAGWLRARKNIWARVVLKRFEHEQHVWYHAVVQLPSGEILDPSAWLGMPT